MPALARDPPDEAGARAALTRAVAAADDPEATGEAEDQAAYEPAREDYRRAVAASPPTRWALRAVERID
jgi:hypothetical protein